MTFPADILNDHSYDYIIPNFDIQQIDTEFLFRNSFGGQHYRMSTNLGHYNLTIYTNHLEIDIYYFDLLSPIVVDLLEDKNLRLSCRCVKRKTKMCEHQAQVLFLIKESKLFRVFFDPILRRKELEPTAKEFGLDQEENLDAYFEFVHSKYGNQLEIKTIKKGILPVNQKSLTKINHLFQTQNQFLVSLDDSVSKDFIVLSYDSYQDVVQVQINTAKTSKEGKVKNPISIIDTEKRLLEIDRLEEMKFFAAIKQLSGYRTKRSLDIAKELKALKEVARNPLKYDFYRHNRRKSDNITSSSIELIKVDHPPIDFSLKIEQKDVFYEIKPQIIIRGRKLPQSQLVLKYDYFLVENGVYYLIDSEITLNFLRYYKEQGGKLLVHQSKFQDFQRDTLDQIEKSVRIEYAFIKKANPSKKVELVSNTQVEKVIYITEEEGYILLTPVFRYGEKEVSICSKQQLYLTDLSGESYLWERNVEEEEQMLSTFYKLYPHFEEQEGQTFFYISKRVFLEEGWFLEAFERWREMGYTILGFNEIKLNTYNQHKAKVSVNVSSGIDWFDTSIQLSYGNQDVSLKQLQKALKNKSKFIELNDGTHGLLPQEWIEKFAKYFRNGEVTKTGIRTSKVNFSFIDEIYERDVLSQEVQLEIQLLKDKLLNFKKIKDVSIPKELKATLRDYQKEGVNWLNFLDEFNFGGCLADDMGLGKTIQIIAFILTQRKKTKQNTNLVVLPTSLIFNWQNELAKFAPSLKILTIYGSDRVKKNEDLGKYEVILTSYGTLLSDVYHLKDFVFNYIFLDESQAIKNPDSQRYKAVRMLQSRNKIVITGTPIENNTFDLYAQLSFACPGLLGTQTHFKEEFAIPIDKFKDFDRAKELQRKVNPFVLRRTKAQVATELPEKTEMVLYCEMGEEQQKVYDAYRAQMREYLNASKKKKESLDTMYMLAALTKLRQICNSPALLNEEGYYGNDSAKIRVLLEEIEEKHSEHKILVFSQFVGMLDLIKIELDKKKIKYAYLTGQSKKREEIVEEFQDDDQIRVFLISLKAGGTGLNLTEADYVYLVDPWWNPAVENQAIDRCYRIGQDKHVVAVRLITPDTIEDKIVSLQSSKKEIAGDIIQTEESVLKKLSTEDLLGLLN